MEQWVSIIVSILSGLAVCIPLVIKLVNAVKQVIQEKNWSIIVKETLELMTEAEASYSSGEEKKTFVMNQIEEMAKELNYDLDTEVISKMIDGICDAARHINTATKTAE